MLNRGLGELHSNNINLIEHGFLSLINQQISYWFAFFLHIYEFECSKAEQKSLSMNLINRSNLSICVCVLPVGNENVLLTFIFSIIEYFQLPSIFT